MCWFYPLGGEGDCVALGQDYLLFETFVIGHSSRCNINDFIQDQLTLANLSVVRVETDHHRCVSQRVRLTHLLASADIKNEVGCHFGYFNGGLCLKRQALGQEQ